jgi:hypothetical protein
MVGAVCFHISNAVMSLGILCMIFIWFQLPLLLLVSLVLTFHIRCISILRTFLIIITIFIIIINNDAYLPWMFLDL